MADLHIEDSTEGEERETVRGRERTSLCVNNLREILKKQ